MGERKVLNKYIPSDFDPSISIRTKKKKDGAVPVRMMLPFSVQCSTCNTFLYRGTKFNSKKEPMSGPNGRYLGIQRYRFYIKCTLCSRTLSFLTDPENTDYEMEHGGTRNYEVYKDKEKTEEESALEKELEEKIDPMKALENRVLDSQREMKELDDLEEIRAMNRKHLKLSDVNAVLDARDTNKNTNTNSEHQRGDTGRIEDEPELNEYGITNEEELLVKSIQFGRNSNSNSDIKHQQYQNQKHCDNGSKAPTILRLNDEDEKREEEKRRKEMEIIHQNNIRKKKMNTGIPNIKVKRKRIIITTESSNDTEMMNTKKQKNNGPLSGAKQDRVTSATSFPPSTTITKTKQDSSSLAGLLGGYGSSSDSE